MVNSKLVQLLKSFNPEEIEWLNKWIMSKVACPSLEIRQLVLYVLSKKRYTQRTLDKKKAYKYIYKEQEYDDLKLRHLMNRTVQVLEKFVHFLNDKNNSYKQQISLLGYYQARKMGKYANQELRKLNKRLEKEIQQDEHFFFKKYEIEQHVFQQKVKGTRSEKTNLQEIFDYQLIAFIANTLKYACTALTHQRLYKKEYDIHLLEQILIKAENYLDIPVIQIYYHAYQSLRFPEEDSHFAKLKQIILEHGRVLSEEELKNIVVVAVNFCVKNFNSGKLEYNKELLDLFKYALEESILLEQNEISRFTYNNIITAALREQELDWIRNFIRNYSKYLSNVYQAPYAQFAQARLAFAEQNYDQCLQLLASADVEDVFIIMSIKMIQIKVFYEQAEIDLLEASLQSFRKYLSRKTKLTYVQTNYLNNVKIVEKLIQLPLLDNVQKEKLRAEIKVTKPLTEAAWLLEQLKETR